MGAGIGAGTRFKRFLCSVLIDVTDVPGGISLLSVMRRRDQAAHYNALGHRVLGSGSLVGP